MGRVSESITPRLLGVVTELPDGEAIVGWKRISQVMCVSVRTAQAIARQDPTFPKRKRPGVGVYVLVGEFMAWYRASAKAHGCA